MKNIGVKIAAAGLTLNLLLFFVKLYVGISINSLAVYCDAINNLGDTLACIVAIMGFFLSKRLCDTKSKRLQSLCTFVIEGFIAITGIYFVYNGIERILYPLPVTYSDKYAVLISVTVLVKIFMAIMYKFADKNVESAVLKALMLDSVLDCFVTVFSLMSILLVVKVGFAIDGVLAIVAGTFIAVNAAKETVEHAKYLINN